MNEEIAEYGLPMSGGGYQIRSADPKLEAIYPTAMWVAHKLRDDCRVYRRRIIVLEDWAPVTPGSVHIAGS